jgi:hypothetical protein
MPNQFSRTRIISTITLLAFSLMASLFSYAQASETPIKIDPALQLHIDLIETGLKTDWFKKRCRGIPTAKSFDKVNRLFVTKYSLTANNFIERYLNEDVQKLKQARLQSFNQLLMKTGGCQAAKSQGWVEQLQTDFKSQYEQVQNSLWYPK